MEEINDDFATKFVSELARTNTTIILNMIEVEELTTALVARIKQIKKQNYDEKYYAILKNIILKVRKSKLDL